MVGDTFSPATADLWAEFLKPFIAESNPGTVLDLGNGSGPFSHLLADRFHAQVISCDLSNVRTLADGAFDLAWLSQLPHAVEERDACARELRRILRPSGHVLIPGTFGDRVDSNPASQRPTIHDVLASFRGQGFFLAGFHTLPQSQAESIEVMVLRPHA